MWVNIYYIWHRICKARLLSSQQRIFSVSAENLTNALGQHCLTELSSIGSILCKSLIRISCNLQCQQMEQLPAHFSPGQHFFKIVVKTNIVCRRPNGNANARHWSSPCHLYHQASNKMSTSKLIESTDLLLAHIFQS